MTPFEDYSKMLEITKKEQNHSIHAWFVFLCFICHTDKVYDYNYKKDAKK